jgi:anti-sigma B factor antagonist
VIPGFTVSIQHLGRRVVVAPHGELDLATAPELTERMSEALGHDFDEIVLQLTDVEFVDLAGVRAIARCEELADAHGASFAVTDPQPQARRLFELCALWRYVA